MSVLSRIPLALGSLAASLAANLPPLPGYRAFEQNQNRGKVRGKNNKKYDMRTRKERTAQKKRQKYAKILRNSK